MTWISVDIESDGPAPGIDMYSMVSVGAVVVDKESLRNCFYAEIAPISQNYDSTALSYNGFTREETLAFEKAETVIPRFAQWVSSFERPMFFSDNAGFDWMFVNFYMHKYYGRNPFGHSCLSLTSFWKGVEKDLRASFKHMRKTRHTHNALDDAQGNAEAFQTILGIIDDGH